MLFFACVFCFSCESTDRGDILLGRYSALARVEYIRSHREERSDHVPVGVTPLGTFFFWEAWINLCFCFFLLTASGCSARTTTTTRPVRRSAGPGMTSSGTIPAASRATRCAYRAGRAPTVRKVRSAAVTLFFLTDVTFLKDGDRLARTRPSQWRGFFVREIRSQ